MEQKLKQMEEKLRRSQEVQDVARADSVPAGGVQGDRWCVPCPPPAAAAAVAAAAMPHLSALAPAAARAWIVRLVQQVSAP
jgi:hypothetical protein